MSYTASIERLHERKGTNAAYAEACETVRRMGTTIDALLSSRFFERQIQEDGSMKLGPTTESAISYAYDVQDLGVQPLHEYLYCDVDGQLYPLTVGAKEFHDIDPDGSDPAPVIYASADMIANGKVVGHVSYTDH